MKQVMLKVFISDEIFRNEYDYLYGSKAEQEVSFTYHNVKKDKEGKSINMTYKKALDFAYYRSRDGRYKNFEYLIR